MAKKVKEDEQTLKLAVQVIVTVATAFIVAIVIDVRHAVQAVERIYGG